MRRRMRVQVDGLGYHAVLWRLDRQPNRLPGWTMGPLGAWWAGWKYRRRIERSGDLWKKWSR
jgi:hypothetical protein